MYKYNEEVEKVKIIKDNNNKEIILYPKYILSDGRIYYDKAFEHDDCMINIFIMNIINGVLKEGNIEEITKYTIDPNFMSDDIFLTLENQIYYKTKSLLNESKNPRTTIIHLLTRLKYALDENVKSIDNPQKLTDLMTSLFLNDKIYPLGQSKFITTSRANIYSTFYNYLIMDYTINKCPKITFDGDNFHIDWSLCYYLGDNEEKLQKEVEFIKRLPRDERYKYLI